MLGLRSVIPATIEALNDWCIRHIDTFTNFFECRLSNLCYYCCENGFISNGRGETFAAYVNEEGKRVAFKGMLNLLEKGDFWVNDL